MRTLMRSAAARSATLQDLQRLSTPEPLPENNPELWRVTLHHARWTENLRRSLNITLARQTAEWIAAREAAAKSVGQCAVLQHLGRQTAPRARD